MAWDGGLFVAVAPRHPESHVSEPGTCLKGKQHDASVLCLRRMQT